MVSGETTSRKEAAMGWDLSRFFSFLSLLFGWAEALGLEVEAHGGAGMEGDG